MKSVRRFLLVGHGGFYNRGCEAIVRSTVDLIREIAPNTSIVLSSFDPDPDAARTRQDGIQIDRVLPARIEGPLKPSPAWAWGALHRRMFFADLLKDDYVYRRHYQQADVVISIGGDNFSDDYGSPRRFFRQIDAAARCGAKTVIWGASVGPFGPPEAEKKWAEYLKRVDLITAREDKTVEYLASLGVTNNVRRVSDPAFLLPAVEPTSPVALGDSDRMIVGIGMSGLMHKYGIMDSYLNASIGLIDHITSEYEAEILLVPHVIQDDPVRDDLSVCQQVAARVNHKARCHVLPGTLNACELKYCISRCDYFIGARTHSTIASLSSLVPTLSIGYSVKAWGINHDLLGCDDYVVGVQSMTSDVLIERFVRLRERRDDVVGRLQVTVPAAKQNARRAGQYLLSLISGGMQCRRSA